MPVGCHNITLTKNQADLLEHLMAATKAMPNAPTFHCGRLLRVPFAWIIHESLDHDVRIAHWNDVLALQRFGLIELHLGDDDLDECTFFLTELASQVYEQYQRAPCSDHGMPPSGDVEPSDSG